MNALFNLGDAFDKLRRRLGVLTEEEARLAYLEQATDQIDLEMRMRELDRRDGPFASHPARDWPFTR